MVKHNIYTKIYILKTNTNTSTHRSRNLSSIMKSEARVGLYSFFKCSPSLPSLWSDQHQRFTTNLPLVNIPWTACIYASDPRLQREAEPHREWEAYHMNWLQGFPYCLTQPCFYGDEGPQFLPWVLIVQAEGNLIDCVCVRHDHIEAILHEEDRERERERTGCGEEN